MNTIPIPPVPPKSVLNTQDQIETFRQMLVSLEETAQYQKDAIAYHTESLSILETEFTNTNAQIELCQSTISTLSKTQDLTPTAAPKPQKNSTAKRKSTKKVEEKPQTTRKAKLNGAKSKSPAKAAKSTVAKSKAKKQTKQTAKKTQGKKSTLPASPILSKSKNITAMVLDFAQKQKGVIGVTDIIKYVYPKGLNEADHKKAFSSFSSVLSLYTKKGVFERTVPGKYLWIGK